jgi:hypothetical protein
MWVLLKSRTAKIVGEDEPGIPSLQNPASSLQSSGTGGFAERMLGRAT